MHNFFSTLNIEAIFNSVVNLINVFYIIKIKHLYEMLNSGKCYFFPCIQFTKTNKTYKIKLIKPDNHKKGLI